MASSPNKKPGLHALATSGGGAALLTADEIEACFDATVPFGYCRVRDGDGRWHTVPWPTAEDDTTTGVSR